MRLLLLVVAWHYQLVYLLAERSPQERDDLRAGTVVARRKGCLAHARGHAVHVAPRHRFIRPFGHIGKRHQVIHHGGTSRAPEEGHDLSAVAGLVRCKEAVTNAAGDAVLRRPLDRLIVISVIGYVIEEVENAVVLHKNTKEVCVQGEEYTILVSCFCPESRNGYYGEWMDLMVSYLRTY